MCKEDMIGKNMVKQKKRENTPVFLKDFTKYITLAPSGGRPIRSNSPITTA